MSANIDVAIGGDCDCQGMDERSFDRVAAVARVELRAVTREGADITRGIDLADAVVRLVGNIEVARVVSRQGIRGIEHRGNRGRAIAAEPRDAGASDRLDRVLGGLRENAGGGQNKGHGEADGGRARR
ncbi:MAG: hypothetical protein WDN31_11070 [Hyphomicrobium sp.]